MGTSRHERCTLVAVARRMRPWGRNSMGPNLEKSTAGNSGRCSPPAAGVRAIAALNVVAQILFDDAAIATSALDLGKRHAQLTRQTTNRRRGVMFGLCLVNHQGDAGSGGGPYAATGACRSWASP